MYNDLFSIGPLTFHTYGLMSAIGIIAAYTTLEARAKKKNLDFSKAFGLLIWCLIFGYLGSKILYCLTILPQLMEDPSLFRRSLTNGWVVYGGILGGMFGGWMFCRRNALPTWRFFDTALASVALAQGFGRIGCFFAGCCYGAETDSFFHVVFHHSYYAPNDVPLIPTQIMSSIFDFALFFFLVWYDNHGKKHDGEPTGLYLVIYSIGRFIVEFWRGDLARGAVGHLSTSQFIAMFTFVVGLIIFIRRRTCKEQPAGGQPEEPVNDPVTDPVNAEPEEPVNDPVNAEPEEPVNDPVNAEPEEPANDPVDAEQPKKPV